ncbi:nucleotide sugar dehydrogenase [Sporomusa termitida]|uniref:UDP-N-acetyl-D-mannosamine dehydrogenase n=1 Tax=Sporomusa termitida TaxID=2377 RepID=A0A517DV45_9FIRM|nr:nucleotide sugar dehydrogenase [Sporomusa termitida]QDR81229.1 UDP-N-acetyl-D-mannosamine dehydrogenase [Sporomusa termitida]
MYDICVIGGCGHVGLPLSITLADRGKKVIVYDISTEAVHTVRQGTMPFHEEGAAGLLQKVLADGTLELSDSPAVISQSKIVIMIIGTPVDEHLNPNFQVMVDSVNQCMPYFRNGQTLILRSTVYPGISERVNDWLREAGLTMNVCFCPERILEGKAMTELYSLPQIISSFTPAGLQECRDLFGLLTTELVEVQPTEAELAKLFTNVWRYIKFAVANQFYMIANDYNLDFYKVYHAVTHRYDRARDLPKAGFAAGPCLFKDAMQLAAFNNGNFYLGHSAMLVNEGLPNYIVQKLKVKYLLNKMTVGILGMAFKGNSDDIRESLSYKLRKILQVHAGSVLSADPYVTDDSLLPQAEVIAQADILIIATPHKQYQGLDIPLNKVTVDIWNVLGRGGLI